MQTHFLSDKDPTYLQNSHKVEKGGAKQLLVGLVMLVSILLLGYLGSQAQASPIDQAEHHFNSGIQLYQLGHLEQAKQEFEIALRLNPAELDAHNNLGAIKAQKGDLEGAIQEFRAELMLDPNHPNRTRILHNIGNALLALGHPQDAVLAFESALSQDPNLVETHISLASALHQLGDDERAQEELEIAIRLDPENPRAHYDLGLLQRAKTPHLALQEFYKAIQFRPRWATAHNSLAITLLQMGAIDEAIAEFRAILLWDPDFKQAQDNLQKALNRWLEAKQTLDC